MKNQISIVLTFLLFLQALFFQVDLPDLVLCFGDDGHVAIEIAEQTDCGHEDDTFAITNKGFLVFDQKHDDCDDINLDLHFSNADFNKSKKSLLNYLSIQPFTSLSKHNHKSQSANQKLLAAKNKQTLNTINTTILLI